jgi:threonine/homoserine/homoserine lactone efflux protein
MGNKVIILDGFKFGLLLQIAIGPICLMTLQISSTLGLLHGFIFVGGTTLVDALYIFLASIGIATFLEKKKIQNYLKIFGSIVLMIFGINIILGIFNITIIPNINIQNINTINNIFIQSLIINLSNPLVIIFWGGVFSRKIVQEGYTQRKIFQFGIGCLLSTIIFFSIIVLTGKFVNILFSKLFIKIINGIVGIILLIIGIKMLINNGVRRHIA